MKIIVKSSWSNHHHGLQGQRDIELIVMKALEGFTEVTKNTRVTIVTGVHQSPSDPNWHIRVDIDNGLSGEKQLHIHVVDLANGAGWYMWDQTTPTSTSNLDVGITLLY